MPTAFSLTYGLDLDTEIASFWAWLQEARNAMNGTGEASRHIRELIESQRETIERFAAGEADAGAARSALTMAVALVGYNYASNQKLLSGLERSGLLVTAHATQPLFETIVEPPLEGAGPPR